MDDYEAVLCVKNEVFVYNIPPRTTNRGYRAADWKLDAPDWTGRLKVVVKGKALTIKLEDKTTGELFAQSPVDMYPGVAVEQVVDSSRYFVIQIKDPSGRSAFIGIGFSDRGDSFDLLVSMQDHFKWVRREEKQAEEEANATPEMPAIPKLNLGFKEGQTIKININTRKQNNDENDDDESPVHTSKPRARSHVGGASGGCIGILPPPPGGIKIPGPPRASQAVAQTHVQPPVSQMPIIPAASHSQPSTQQGGNIDLLMGLDPTPVNQQPLLPQNQTQNSDPWGDFTSASGPSNSNSSNGPSDGGAWINFD